MRKSIQCWQCGTRMTLDALASNDGDCPECEVEIHLGEYLSEALDTNQRLEAELAALKAKAHDVASVPDASAMADRFISWPLPVSVRPDDCVMNPEYPHRYGTNLLTWTQAKEMFEYVFAVAPKPASQEKK